MVLLPSWLFLKKEIWEICFLKALWGYQAHEVIAPQPPEVSAELNISYVETCKKNHPSTYTHTKKKNHKKKNRLISHTWVWEHDLRSLARLLRWWSFIGPGPPIQRSTTNSPVPSWLARKLCLFNHMHLNRFRACSRWSSRHSLLLAFGVLIPLCLSPWGDCKHKPRPLDCSENPTTVNISLKVIPFAAEMWKPSCLVYIIF